MSTTMDELTDLDRRILAFEETRWRYAGAKESAIRAEFDMSATRYYQERNRVISLLAALEHSPLLVARLRRLRAVRADQRSVRRLAFDV